MSSLSEISHRRYRERVLAGLIQEQEGFPVHRRVTMEHTVLAPSGAGNDYLLSSANIQRIVAAEFGLTRQDILGRSRCKSHILPRLTAMYLARRLTAASFPRLGMLFGRDKTCITNAISRVEELMAADPAFKKRVEMIESRLRT